MKLSYSILIFVLTMSSSRFEYVTEPTQQRTKTFTWDHFASGDCEMKINSLTITSDGMIFLDCEMWTNSTVFGDLWHITFKFLNKEGAVIWTSPNLDPNSRKMFPGKKDHYNQGAFKCDANLFDDIDTVQLIGEC